MSEITHQLIALLPMKAHSQRVTSKNFRNFAGKPLYRWILDTLLALPEIDLIVINTDARDILRELGLESGGRVLIRDRKPEICGDLVSMNLVLADDIENISAQTYLMTHTTNPLLGTETVREAISRFDEYQKTNQADSLFSVTKRQSRFYRGDGSPINHDPDNLVRTQDLEPWFEENSNLYLFTKKSFQQTRARIGHRPAMFEIPKLEAFDIDDQDDWSIAEAIARTQITHNIRAKK